ncbi:MAG: hypothetical protein EAZ68_23195, partial [Oscillatoriales cyanobacterium]
MFSKDPTKSASTIPFSGRAEDFFKWSAKFLAYCDYQGCKDVLLGKIAVPPASMKLDLDSIKDEDNINDKSQDTNEDEARSFKLETIKEQIRARDMNKLAMVLLNLSMSDGVSVGAIYNANTTALPDGDANLAWENLSDIYKPKSSAKRYDLEQEFNKCVLWKEDKNPDEWFSELERIRLQLRMDFDIHMYDDEKLISHILYNTKPRLYDTIITVLKRDFMQMNEERGDTVNEIREYQRKQSQNLAKIKMEIRQVYANTKIGYKKYSSRESVLMTTGKNKKPYKPFKGTCRICGKRGHKAVDCFENKNKQQDKSRTPNRGHSANIAGEREKGKMKCSYCGKDGHTVDFCFKKQRDDRNKKNGSNHNAQICLMTIAEQETCLRMDVNNKTAIKSQVNANTFIADSGATCHMVNSIEGMIDYVEFATEIKVGNESTMLSTHKGTFKGVIMQGHEMIDISLADVLVVPDLWVNLLSLTKVISNSKTRLSSDEKGILKITYHKKDIYFDKQIKNGSGYLLGVDITPNTSYNNSNETCNIANDEKSIDINKFHDLLGHANYEVVRTTAKHLHILLSGKERVCEHCAMSKIRKKSVNKFSTSHATVKGERLFIDISEQPLSTSFGGAQYWLLILDDHTDYVWSYFLKHKSETSSTMMNFLQHLRMQAGVKVQKIRMDNSGENLRFKTNVENHKYLHYDFELTPTRSPEYNGKVERKFATLWGKVRSMLNGARLTMYLRKGLWAQCAKYVTDLENIIVKKNKTTTAADLFYGRLPPWINNLRTFGEIGAVGNLTELKAKLRNRGQL